MASAKSRLGRPSMSRKKRCRLRSSSCTCRVCSSARAICPRKMTNNRERKMDFFGTVTVSILEARLDSSGHYVSNSFAVMRAERGFSRARPLRFVFRFRRHLRNARRHRRRDEEQKCAEIPGRSRNGPLPFWVDEKRERERKQSRPEHHRDRAQTADGALQFALLRLAHAMRHHSVRRWARYVPDRNDRNRSQINRAASRQPSHQNSQPAKKLAEIKCPPFSDARDDRTHQPGRNHRGANAGERERRADASGRPRVTIDRVERPDVKNFVREVADELDRRELE